MFADFQPKLPAALSRRARRASSATSIRACRRRVLEQLTRAAAGRLRHHEPLDRRDALRARRALLARVGHAGHQRRGGAPARAASATSCAPRRASSRMGPKTRAHQARRVRRASSSRATRCSPCRPFRSRRSSTRPAPATASPAASWAQLARSGDSSAGRPAPRDRLRQRDGVVRRRGLQPEPAAPPDAATTSSVATGSSSR